MSRAYKKDRRRLAKRAKRRAGIQHRRHAMRQGRPSGKHKTWRLR